jgi:hypothetical protein
MDKHELRALKKEILKLERKLISEHQRTKDYCMRCKELYCHSYAGHMKRKVGTLQELYRLKGILRNGKGNAV